MNFLEQFAILIACLFAGSILKSIIPLPIPETIYGMAILFILFVIKALKTSDIKRASETILENMSFLFVPAGVGIIENFDLFKENFVAMILITFISASIAMIVTMALVHSIQTRRNDV